MNLGIAGQSIERVSFDFALTLLTENGAELRVEVPFSLHRPDGLTVVINPEDPVEAMAVLPAVLHQMVTRSVADRETGSLLLEFSHGSRIEVPSSDSFEAWTFATQQGVQTVALPGGGLSTWGAEL